MARGVVVGIMLLVWGRGVIREMEGAKLGREEQQVGVMDKRFEGGMSAWEAGARESGRRVGGDAKM